MILNEEPGGWGADTASPARRRLARLPAHLLALLEPWQPQLRRPGDAALALGVLARLEHQRALQRPEVLGLDRYGHVHRAVVAELADPPGAHPLHAGRAV